MMIMNDLRELTGYINKVPCVLSIGVGGVCINNGKVLLVKNTKADYWSFPGGHVHENESLTEALKRELMEESSIEKFEIINGPIFYQYKLNNKLTLLLFFYKINIIKTPSQLQSTNDEVVESKWFDIDKTPSNVYENTAVILNDFSE